MIRFKADARSLGGVGIAIAAGIGLWLFVRAGEVHTSDARVRAGMVTVSSDVAGRIVELAVAAGDRVKAGDVLARLDDREVGLSIGALALEIKSLEAEVEREKLRAGMSKAIGGNRVDAREAELAAARADLAAAATRLATAEAEFRRAAMLKRSGLVSEAAMDRSTSQLATARQDEARARAEVAAREADIGEARAEAGEPAVISQNIEALSLRAHALRQQLALKKDERGRHVIVSPVDGVIDEVFADAGEYVSPGARIALAHDPAHVWIEANIKETEIGKVGRGAEVQVRLDASRGTCPGRVERIGESATAEFALIPNANPTGVFTKITQRVPVRVSVDAACKGLRPGGMARLTIRAHDNARAYDR